MSPTSFVTSGPLRITLSKHSLSQYISSTRCLTRTVARRQRRAPYIRSRWITTSAFSTSDASNDTINKHIVLLSGGVESSTLLRKAVLEAENPATPGHIVPLFFRYGQKTVEQEHAASRSQCAQWGLEEPVEADLTHLGETFRHRQKKRLHIPLLHRNLVLLSVATSLATQEGAGRISIALSKDDANWYPTASRAFVDGLQGVVAGLQDGLRIETPLAEMGKGEVVRMGMNLGVDFGTTWSCMIGGKRRLHCGRCSQCRARKMAFAACGVAEREGFYER